MDGPPSPARDTVTLWAPVVGVAGTVHLKVGLEEPWMGSDLGLAVTSLALAGPLLLRRRLPWVAALLIAASLPAQEALGGSLSFGSFVAVLVVVYSCARHATWTEALAGAALVLVGVILAARESLPQDAGELVFPAFYISASTALGAVVRRLSAQAETLRSLNAALARERDASARLAVTTERLRLARDLHDSVAHTLTVAVVQAERCEQALPHDPDAARVAAEAIQRVGRQGLAQLRSTVRVLRDPDATTAAPDLRDLPALTAVLSDSGLDVDLRVQGDPSSLPPGVSQEMFRVAQEALTNVVKHSGSTSAAVRLCCDAAGVELEVVDPGPPLARSVPSGTFGLAGMRERLEQLRGALDAGPDRGSFRVHARLPLPRTGS